MQENEVVEQEGVETPESQEETPVQAAPVEADKERNLRVLRESKERAERERDEAVKVMRQMEESRRQEQPKKAIPKLDPDDLATGEHLSSVQEEIREVRQQMYLNNAMTRLKSQYSDFDKVVSEDNVKMLKDLYPEIAQTLISNSDIYSKGVSAYTLLKNLGIHKDIISSEEKDAVERNKSKPRPLTSISPQQGDSPLSRVNVFANGLTEDLKIQLRKEMEEARRNH